MYEFLFNIFGRIFLIASVLCVIFSTILFLSPPLNQNRTKKKVAEKAMIIIIVAGLAAIFFEAVLLHEKASSSDPSYISTVFAWLLFASTVLMLIGALIIIGVVFWDKIRNLPFQVQYLMEGFRGKTCEQSDKIF